MHKKQRHVNQSTLILATSSILYRMQKSIYTTLASVFACVRVRQKEGEDSVELHSQNSFEHSSGFSIVGCELHRVISLDRHPISHPKCMSVTRLSVCTSDDVCYSRTLFYLFSRRRSSYISIVGKLLNFFNFILYFIVNIQTFSGPHRAIYFLVLIFHLFSSSFEFLVFSSLVL